MINIELPQLNAQNILSETLRSVETICEQYGLHDHFGTLSLAVSEMAKLMFACANNDFAEADVNFYLDNQSVAVEFCSNINCADLKAEFSDPAKASDDVFTIARLADNIEFSSNSDVKMEFALSPCFNLKGRMAQVEQEAVASRNKSYID